ncbi:RagB/SusD family nutrient uptake outer membrane protein [Chitinophaga nivalis]|uniref:RagB/SusD family nutrient uptake outer membrane protein n=1 Tax=Chitinophaga nivalis TaxID=2991709 RepID=A0ABT3IEM1_9BACT|nr:RagB/SusD family nutrient uptake outer membrane protein [Chitinophaga nivalis]MCW3467901.1 RagB/SusD family nutrient uptake outer membrane protein [Chitinophaga nivalis]MCW3482408.1 RagB/SusD family nutrient uptake outer membrane protein [Chitinophaga nivalis]
MAFTPGCKKYLEQLPDQRTEVNSPAKVAELLGSAYPRASYIPFLEGMSDNVQDKGTDRNDRANRQSWFWEDLTDREQDTPDFYWQNAYAAIAAANQALAVIDAASDKSAYSASKGEALLARAYAHFMLVTIYSKAYDAGTAGTDPGIPYVTTPENVVIKKYERKTVAYVYEQIEKDLTEGLPLINDNSYTGAPSYHFTTTAAHAFATRFYLFKKDYAKVVAHANSTFVGVSALPYLRPVNTVYSKMSPGVAQKEYTKATTKANLLLAESRSVWARNLETNRYGCDPKLADALRDINVSGASFDYKFYYRAPENQFTPKFEELFIRVDQNANIGTPWNMIPLLTAEEVLFNRAEANTELGNYDDAITDLNDFISQRATSYNPLLHSLSQNKVRAYYKTPDTRAALISSILTFKRSEFVFEGLRWFDILRHKLPVTHISFDGKTRRTLGPSDPRRMLQLPQEAQLSGLELNPR